MREEKDYLFHFKNISKTFRNGNILNFVGKIHINRGCFTFFTGESGIGKSTLLHILGLLDRASATGNDSCLKYRPAPDSQIIDYFDYHKQDLKYKVFSQGRCARLRRVDFGFLPQDGHLLHSLSRRQNLEIVYILRYQPTTKNINVLDELGEIIRRVKFDEKNFFTDGKYSPAPLSGGEKQRLALARAILCKPKVIFVDEPTTFMDDKLIKQAMEVLFDLVLQNGCSIIVVTHQYEELSEILNKPAKEVKIDRIRLIENDQTDNEDEKTVLFEN